MPGACTPALRRQPGAALSRGFLPGSWILLALVASCAAPPQSATSIPSTVVTASTQAGTASPLAAYAFPTTIDPGSRYLFYLHGRIIEEQGLGAVDPVYGAYQYEAILDRLASTGLIVISEQREKDTNPFTYAQRIKAQVESLQRAGVPSENITILGASKGGYIAALSSYILEDPALNVVLLGSCDPGMIDEWRSSGRRLYGNVLAIYDIQDDEYSGSCAELFELSAAEGLGQHDELLLHVGTGHGILYQPLDEWILPALEWAAR